MLEDRMPITFDSVGIEDGHEVERMWLGDIIDGKWVEDYVVVQRSVYDIETDEYGAVFALIENGQNSECHPSSLEDDRVVTDKGKAIGRMLVKAPNVKHYRIPADVYRIAANAFQGCTELTDIDIPYCIDDFEIEKALEWFSMTPESLINYDNFCP